MADTENVRLESIDTDSSSFGEDLNSNFGIQDTQVLASEELKKFLTSDITPNSDPNKVKAVDDEDIKDDNEDKDKNKDKSKEELTEAQKAEQGRQALEKSLFDETKGDKTDTTTTTTEDDKNEGEDDTFNTLANDLLRLGVFSKDSEDQESLEIKSGEEFLDKFRLEQKKGAISILDNFLSQFGPEYRRAFDAIFVNGVEPKEYLTTFSRIESVKDLDLTNEDNQKKVIREYYKSLKWDDEKISNKIEKLKDYEELEDEAKSYHEVLLNKEKEQEENLLKSKQKEIEDRKLQENATLSSYQRILNEKLKTKDFDGIPLTDREAQEVYAYMANKPYKLENGELLSEFDKDLLDLNRPENHELKIKLAMLMKKKLDLSVVKKTAVSKGNEELFTLNTKNKSTKQEEKKMKSFFS